MVMERAHSFFLTGVPQGKFRGVVMIFTRSIDRGRSISYLRSFEAAGFKAGLSSFVSA